MIGYSLPASRKNAACVPPTLVRIELGDVGDRQAEQRRLGPVHLDREFGTSFVAARRARSALRAPGP